MSNIPSLALNTVNGQTYAGPSITISGNLTFDTLDWDSTVTFSNPSPIGTLTQGFSLYDGMACQQNYT